MSNKHDVRRQINSIAALSAKVFFDKPLTAYFRVLPKIDQQL